MCPMLVLTYLLNKGGGVVPQYVVQLSVLFPLAGAFGS